MRLGGRLHRILSADCSDRTTRGKILPAMLPGEESVKRFEQSNGLDTALYKTIPLPLPLCSSEKFHMQLLQSCTIPLVLLGLTS